MTKPVFKYSKVAYAVSAVLTIPLLIDICTACHLFSLWIAWLLFILIGAISIVRLWFGFRQKCYRFSWGLIGELLLGAGVLVFFQLSYNRVINTPVSNPLTPAVVDIQDPFLELDSTRKADSKKIAEPKDHKVSEDSTDWKDNPADKK